MNASFEISGAAIANFGIGASAEYVDKIILTFDNVEVQEYPLETLSKITEKLGRTCKDILKEQVKSDNAFQVISVVKADVGYKVNFKVGASVSAKEKALTAISAKLGAGIAAEEGVVGKGLYYGVSLRKQLAVK